MTKKDYILIAEAVKAACLDAVSRKSVVAKLGLKFAEDNPRFNYDTFRRACGVSDTPMEELERYGR